MERVFRETWGIISRMAMEAAGAGRVREAWVACEGPYSNQVIPFLGERRERRARFRCSSVNVHGAAAMPLRVSDARTRQSPHRFGMIRLKASWPIPQFGGFAFFLDPG